MTIKSPRMFQCMPVNIQGMDTMSVSVNASIDASKDPIELGPVYTKHQRQRCDNSAMTLAILLSLKSVESLENRLQTHSGATPLFSMRTELQASSLSCCSVDADAWCKWSLTLCKTHQAPVSALTIASMHGIGRRSVCVDPQSNYHANKKSSRLL